MRAQAEEDAGVAAKETPSVQQINPVPRISIQAFCETQEVAAIVGAKGGVGSSTIAHNVAWSIASGLDVSTIIADLDLGFGTAGLDYNQDPPQGIAEAVFAPDRVDANLVDRFLSKCSEN